MGAYKVVKIFENEAVEVKAIDRWNYVFLVNGHRLKVYFQPLTKEDFMQRVQQPFENELIGGSTNMLKIWFLLILIEKNNKIKIKRKNEKNKKYGENFFPGNYENQFTDMIAEGSTWKPTC